MATLVWESVSDLYDNLCIDVHKCKLCPEFATTQRNKCVVHIKDRHASIQDDSVVINRNIKETTVYCGSGGLEETSTFCEEIFLTLCASVQGGSSQSTSARSVDVTTQTELDLNIEKGEGDDEIFSTRSDTANRTTDAENSGASQILSRSSPLSPGDDNFGILDDVINADEESDNENSSQTASQINSSSETSQKNIQENYSETATQINPECVTSQDSGQKEVSSDGAPELQAKSTKAIGQKRESSSSMHSVEEASKVIQGGKEKQQQQHHCRSPGRAGLRPPGQLKRKVFQDCVEDNYLASKESDKEKSDLPHKCNKCDFTTEHLKALKGHQWSHKSEESKKVVCLKCKKRFANSRGLRRHRLGCGKTESDVENKSSQESEEGESKLSDEGNEKDEDWIEGETSKTEQRKESQSSKSCHLCGFLCKSERGFKIHMHKHAESRKPRTYACDECGKKYTTKDGVTKHKRGKWCRKGVPRPAKSYKCAVCKKQFQNKMIYREHMTVHSAVRNHVCSQCSKTFKTARARKRHEETHTSEPLKCSLCDFTTQWKGSLKTHYVGKHDSLSRPLHSCPICPFTTRSAMYISKHIMTHSEDRPYMCEHCGKSFKADTVLRAHMETHDNEKLYPCDKCDYVGGTRAAIYNHRASHIPKDQMQFRCDQCNWVGKRNTELQVHLRKHSAMKLFRCGHCGQSYKHKHGLTRHLKEKHMVQPTVIPEVIFPAMDLDTQEATMALSALPVAQFFEISTEILADSNSNSIQNDAV